MDGLIKEYCFMGVNTLLLIIYCFELSGWTTKSVCVAISFQTCSNPMSIVVIEGPDVATKTFFAMEVSTFSNHAFIVAI